MNMGIKSFASFLLAFLMMTVPAFSQQGYEIKVQLDPVKNQYIYLGYHYGKLKALADSALVNEQSMAVFKGDEPLKPGIYFLVSPGKTILFEMLIDKDQHFSIAADTTLPDKLIFTGSATNSKFLEYTRYVSQRGQQLTNARQQIQSLTGAERDELQKKMNTWNQEISDYRNNFENQEPESIIAAYFRAMKEPTVPPANLHPGGKYDSLYAYRYFKDNFWNGVSFADERLIRTPFFEAKLNRYYDQLVSPVPDSIIAEVDLMLAEAVDNKEMFRYLLSHFIDKYINPQYMGQDKVFVHLFEKYISVGMADWLTESQRKTVYDRAYSLIANQIGAPAANVTLTDTTGKSVPLYSIKGKYTVIYFWDPTCGFCKETVPKVDSIFQNKWKHMDIKLVGVMVDGGKEAWMNYIRKNNLKDWIHLYQTDKARQEDYDAGRPSYRQLYDVYQTPVLYLLDEQKRIVAKKLTYDQLDKIIEAKK